MNYQEKNVLGIKKQLLTLTERLNKVRDKRGIETDPELCYKYDERIIKLKEQISQLKNERNQIEAESFGLQPYRTDDMLSNLIEILSLKVTATPLNLVNCDRNKADNSISNQKEKLNGVSTFFCFINACNSQRPQSLCERIVYKTVALMNEDELNDSVFYPQTNTEPIRLKKAPLPQGGTLKQSITAFKKYFQGQFGKDCIDLESGNIVLTPRQEKLKLLALVFKVGESNWKDFYPEYFDWIVKHAYPSGTSTTEVFLFFSVFNKDLHTVELKEQKKSLFRWLSNKSDGGTKKKKNIIESINKISETYENVLHYHPLHPVLEDEFADWVRVTSEVEMGETAISQLVKAIVENLDEEARSTYQKTKKLDMEAIEKVQEKIYLASLPTGND